MRLFNESRQKLKRLKLPVTNQLNNSAELKLRIPNSIKQNEHDWQQMDSRPLARAQDDWQQPRRPGPFYNE